MKRIESMKAFVAFLEAYVTSEFAAKIKAESNRKRIDAWYEYLTRHYQCDKQTWQMIHDEIMTYWAMHDTLGTLDQAEK